MYKEIVVQDIDQIRDLLKKVTGSGEYTKISRLGGLTNHTYMVETEDMEYVVRIPGEGTESIINRKNEKISTKLACGVGIDADLLYFDEYGAKVTRYIPNAVTMNKDSLKETENIKLVAEVLRKLHSCGKDSKVPFEVFESAGEYEGVIFDKNVPMFEDYSDVKAEVMRIKSETDKTIGIKKVPCHNDPLCENWVKSDDKMYLIDWEYAGMNDGMWDLADVSIEAEFEDCHDDILLKEYLGREPELFNRKHLLVNKIYVDYLWTLWAKARVPYDGQPMEDWAVERYSRLKVFIEKYKSM